MYIMDSHHKIFWIGNDSEDWIKFHLILVKLMDTAISNHVMFYSHSSSFGRFTCRAASGVNCYQKTGGHSKWEVPL